MSKQIVPATKRELFDALKRSIERAEAAEARAEQLAAQLATAQDAIERVKKERDEAKKVCDYWLHHARFLADDYHKDSEYNLAVESLKAYKLQEGIEP